jgi:putative ABC transport system substrate-binding protein
MRRREFIALLGGALAAAPGGVRAQQRLPVIGFLSSASVSGPVPGAFFRGLRDSGYFPGQNVTIDIQQAEGHYDRLPALAADLVRRQVKLIVAAGGLVSARAAMAATTTIPILFIAGYDPVKLGLVASFNRPGGNATGISIYTTELLAKRLEFLRELVPKATRVALLVNQNVPATEIEIKDMQAVAAAIGLQLAVLRASTESELEAAFPSAVDQRTDVLLVSADPFFSTRRRQIVALAARHSLPAIYPWREYIEVGGLMSYGPTLMEAYYLHGLYASRILKGERPGDLPVQVPRTFELIINLGTAKALNLTVPRIMRVRSDHLID